MLIEEGVNVLSQVMVLINEIIIAFANNLFKIKRQAYARI